MGIFRFNGNKSGFDLSVLRAGISIGEDNELLKKYDKNNNSIFDAPELAKFKEDAEKADKNGDKIISESEAAEWAEALKVPMSEQNENSSRENNTVFRTFEYLYTASAKINASEQLRGDVNQALEIVKGAHGGYVSQGWNALKEFFNSDNAESNVNRQLLTRLIGSIILDILSEGDMDLDDLTTRYIEVLREKIPDFSDYVSDRNGELFREVFHSLVELHDQTELGTVITFDQVYKNLTNVDFNPERINKYRAKAIQAQFVTTVNNNLTAAQAELINPYEAVYWDVQNNKPLPALDNPRYPSTQTASNCRALLKGIYNALKRTYNGNDDKINEYLTRKFNITSVESIPYMSIADRQNILNMAKTVYDDIANIKNNILKDVLGNKSIEQFSNELNALYQNSYGENSLDVAKSFAESQQTGVAVAKIATGAAGVAIIIFSGGSLTPVVIGTAASIVGMPGVSLVEGLSKEGGMTPEDWSVFKTELKESALFGAAGFGIGMTSAKIGATLLKSCPQFMGKVASLVASKSVEYATDFAMTVIADMAITGDIHLSADSISELVNVIVGIAVAKKVRTQRRPSQSSGHQETPSTPSVQPSQGIKPNEPKTAKSILADKNHRVTSDEMDVIRRDVERIFNSDKPTAQKLEELRAMNEELSKMPQTQEVMSLQRMLEGTETSLKNLKDVEDVLREAGFKDEGSDWKDELTISDEISDLASSGEVRTYKTKDGEVRIKYDKENDTFIIENNKPSKELEGGVRDTDLTEVAHEARHLAGSGDKVANPVFDPAAADRICAELNLTETDKFIIENLREGDTHIIDGPDNTEIVITRASEDYDVQVRIKEDEVSLKGGRIRRRVQTDPYELQPGQMNKNTGYNINPDKLPVLELGGEYIDLNNPEYAHLIYSLKEGTGITIGRVGTIQTSPNNEYISRIHVEIYKENGQIKIRDVSTNGTRVVSSAENAYVKEASTGVMMRNMAYEVSMDNLPVLEFPGGVKLDLNQYKPRIANMRDGQTLMIGRDADIPVSGNDYISRQHVILYKSNGVIKIKNIHQNQVKIQSNGFLDRIKNKINDLMNGHKSSASRSRTITLTEQERALFNSFRNHPEVRALATRPAELKQFLERMSNIVADRSVVSDEIAEALIKGQAKLNGRSPEGVTCMVEQNVLNDIVKLSKGEDYIMHFPRGMREKDILRQLPVGEAANIGGQMYVNNGTSLEKLNLSEDRFRQLFPPVKRFSTHQGAVGDCYLVSTLERMYSSPLGRVKIYRRIGEDQNGIYTLTANNNYEKTYFRRFDSQNKHIEEEGGLAILEQGWCKNSAKNARNFNPRETIIMDVNAGGLSNWAIGGLIGRQPTRVKDPATIRRYIMQYANDPNTIINIGTRSGGHADDTHFHSRQYNIYTNHEYSIKGYNPQNDCVILCNPHHSGCVVEVPLNEFMSYCDDFTIISMNS